MATVGILGAGTMGAGIAQTAATSGWDVRLSDVDEATAAAAIEGIARRLDRLVEKGRLTAAQREAALGRLHASGDVGAFGDCDLVIEAVVEDLQTKIDVLSRVAKVVSDRCILASNTSSLSIGRLGMGIGDPARTVGMHFFNPVPLMPLVEIIAGPETRDEVAERAAAIAREWGKTPVRAKDTPGFIVNRVARGYYLEPLRMLGEGIAGIDEIDRIMRTLGGFRMGPFELMDLVGIDVNYTVSTSVYEQLGRPARLKPHPIQKTLLERGTLGRKSKQGFYSYQHEHPLPAVPVERASFELPEMVYKAVRLFSDKATDVGGSITEQYVFARTLVAIINEAALAVDEGVASEADIDTAMKLGTNYPKGPLEWAEQIGRRTCRFLLDQLNEVADDRRFAAAAWLRT